MRFYKETNFKDTEIGKIPKDWEVVRLGEVAIFETGKRMKGGGLADGEVLSLGGEHIGDNGNVVLDNPKHITKEFYDKLRKGKLRVGDIILCKDGAKTGKVAFLKEKIADFMAVNEHIFIIRPKVPICDNVYLFYFLFSFLAQKQIQEIYHGIIGGITNKQLANLLFILPPLSEQEKIAEILSTVDELIQRTDEIIAKTERLKKGLMQELLTKGIGHKEFKETEIGRIPKDWEVVRLGDIAADMYYGITAKAVNERTPLRMLRTTDIKDYKAEWDNLPFCQITERRKDIQKYFLQIGDLIISRAGTAGMSVLVDKPLKDVIFGSYLIKIKLKENVHPKYLQFFFRSRFYWDHILSGHAGSTLKNINLPVLKATPVILPPIPEQEKIAEILSTVDERIEIERKRKEKLERIKKSLMDLLLTGKIRVRVEEYDNDGREGK